MAELESSGAGIEIRATSRGLTLSTIIEWLSAIVAIAAPLYLLGLSFLTVQIATTYQQDFAIAWYAASLVSSKMLSVVAFNLLLSQNIQVAFLLGLFQIGVIVIIYWLSPNSIPTSYQKDWRFLLPFFLPRTFPIPSRRMFLRGQAELWTLFLLSNIVHLAFYIYVWTQLQFDWRKAVIITIVYILFRFTMLMWSIDITQGRSLPIRLMRAALLSYISVALISLTVSGFHPGPPLLPYVEVSSDTAPKIQARLLNHADGYWHILTEQDGTYMAIPDSNAKTVVAPKRTTAIPTTATPISATPIP